MSSKKINRTVTEEIAIWSEKKNLEEQMHWLNTISFKKNGKILDIGCGPGLHLKYFKEEKGLIGYGTDRWPEVFQYHNEIEFIHNLNNSSLHDKFDYVFCSHILEHCPNPFEAIKEWKKFLVNGGHLIIALPPYNSIVCNDHLITGWNVGQLAMTMVASGFDCSESTFMQFGQHVCGHGVKNQIKETNFLVKESLPYLPKGLRDTFFEENNYHFIIGDLSLADKKKFIPLRNLYTKFPILVDKINNCKNLVFEEKKEEERKRQTDTHTHTQDGEWKDYYEEPKVPLDIFCQGEKIFLIVFYQGKNVGMRLCLASQKSDKLFENAADIWLNIESGFNFFTLIQKDFKILRGTPNFKKIDHWCFGGKSKSSELQFWFVDEKGNSFFNK